MADLPATGTFKIQTVGKLTERTAAKTGKPYKVYDLQFNDDPQWYNTFWTMDKAPEAEMDLAGTKSYDEKYTSYKFEIEGRGGGGKGNWNPAAAQATVMLAGVEIINGFLALPGHYELWEKSDPKLKPLFQKYVTTVDAASKQIKEKVVSMGALTAETKVAEKASASAGDPGPTPPPNIDAFPDDQEPVDV